MTKFYRNRIGLLVILIYSLTTFSCSSVKKTKYFQDIADSGQLKNIPKAEYVQPKIQADDILTVILQTVDPQASALVNMGNVSTSTTNVAAVAGAPSIAPTPNSGYLVNEDGDITLPIMGKIRVAGLTTTQARDLINKAADNFYKDHSVIVRFANFRINLAGEVLKPGTYIMPNEKVTILDAITMAGDLTIYGERDNVLVIRENPDGSKTPFRVNLKGTSFMTSPVYYLKSNDYIYVEPSKGKEAANDLAQTRLITIFASVLSLLIVIATRAH